jgi:predicted oxidoreductase
MENKNKLLTIMKKVLLSDSGPETSEAIYSFWRWNNKEDLNLDKIQDILEYVIGLGINAFDVSSIYGNGKIQELLGEALSNSSVKREDLVLFSKISNKIPQSDGTYLYEPLTEKSVIKQVDNLLLSLKTEYIDVLLIEDFDPLMNVDVVASVLTSLQLRGKIKHVGVSNFNVQQHKLFASRLSEEVVTNHFELNLLQTKALEDGRLDFIKEQYSKPMAFGPLADGRILQGQDAKALTVRKVLSSLTEKYESNIEQIAVAWIHKLGALPIIGSLSKERIHNAATAGDIQLSYQDWHQIYETIKSINS